MSQPRRALATLTEEAVSAPRRGLAPKRGSLSGLAFPIGIAAPLAAAIALATVSTAAADPSALAVNGAGSGASDSVIEQARSDRTGSRSTVRHTLPLPQEAPQPAREEYRPGGVGTVTTGALKATGTRYATANLKVRQVPLADSKTLATLAVGDEVQITNETFGAYRLIVYKGKAAWVTAKHLTAKKPAAKPASTSGGSAPATSSVSGQITQSPCAAGSRVENGLRANTIKLYRSVCASFPQITSYGGVRADSMPYHPSGRALDIMLPSLSQNALGWQIARWVVANASSFNVDHVIFDQQIWVKGMGWRGMSNRGSATANHRDHVHVTVD